MIIIAVVNLKGGSSKTTTAGFLGAAFHETGMRVLGVDADGENESLQEWHAAEVLPWPVVTLAVPNMHVTLPGVAGDRYDVVVIDTPPMKAQRGTVVSAARIATHLVIPMAPTPIEYARLPAVQELLEDVASLRPDGRAPHAAVLFTRVKKAAASAATYRDLVTDAGMTVLKAQVGSLERYAQAWGDPIKRAAETPYGDAALELLDLGEDA